MKIGRDTAGVFIFRQKTPTYVTLLSLLNKTRKAPLWFGVFGALTAEDP